MKRIFILIFTLCLASFSQAQGLSNWTIGIPYVLCIVENICDDNNPDNDYFLQKTNTNTYRVINPCQNYIQYIHASELYDIYGTKTNDLTPEQDKVDFNNAVNSGELKVIKVIVNGKILTKTIITD